MATQGLSNYLKNMRQSASVKVAIAYDSRNSSSYFGKGSR
jgi:phosphomannomutase